MRFEWKYAPKHIKLTPTQAKRELKAINVSLEEIPLIKYSDAAITNLVEQGEEIEVNDVIKIIRNSKVGGEVPYYRRVIY
jgi:DNA-directed RNA polymerase subunit H (RpoH/RPB5)|tara:strand:- start:209 stop:448 length:240 start_codon:yes stop_codon:yes gene_type:complete